MKNNPFVLSHMILITFLLFFVFVTACGRKGDPVPLPRYELKPVEINADENREVEETDIIIKDKVETGEKEIKPVVVVPPTNLSGVHIGKSIVIVWDEVKGQEVRLYNIYRSYDGEYRLIGDTAISVYTDKNIKSNTKYYYKVTAVGTSESDYSKEIAIVTEDLE